MILPCKAIEPPAARVLVILLTVGMPYEIWHKGLPGTYEIQNLSIGLILRSIAHYKVENPEVHTVLSVGVDLVLSKHGLNTVAKHYLKNTADDEFNYWFISGVGLIETVLIIKDLRFR